MQYVLQFKPKYVCLPEGSLGKYQITSDVGSAFIFRDTKEAREVLKHLPVFVQAFLEVVPIERALSESNHRQGLIANEYTEG